MRTEKRVGNLGETLAAHYLKQRGYVILETNWRCQYGEIDIVAKKEHTLVFVEVKTRRNSSAESAFGNITPAKRQRLILSANTYLHAGKVLEDHVWRIDVIAVILSRNNQPLIEHAEDALGW